MSSISTFLQTGVLGLVAISSAAIRIDDELQLDTKSAPEDCSQTCTKSGQGLYEVCGEAAVRTSWRLRPETRYFVSETCAQAEDETVSVVPWVDSKDPLHASCVSIYVEPMRDVLLKTTSAAKICAEHLDGSAPECLCQLRTETSEGTSVLERSTAVLPRTASKKVMQLQFAMQRRCLQPSIMNVVCIAVICLILLPVLFAVEAFTTLRSVACEGDGGGSPLTNAPEDPNSIVFAMTPLKQFRSGAGWAVGLVMSIVSLQSVALMLAAKSDIWEGEIWLILVFPSVLALLGVYRLLNLHCQKQLESACLLHGLVLTTPSRATKLDAFLVICLTTYGVGVLLLVGKSSMRGLAMVLTALAGPAWTMTQYLLNARETESQLQRVEANRNMSGSWNELCKMKTYPWSSAVVAGRHGVDFLKADMSSEVDEAQNCVQFQLAFDIGWQRRSILRLAGSKAGFLVLPFYAALTSFFLSVLVLQATGYSCSKGELTRLELASSLHTLNFQPWQNKYEVHMDASFKQAAMVAFADVPLTREIAFQQPEMLGGDSSIKTAPIKDDSGGAVANVQLSKAFIPRVATVWVQGLRPSLPPTPNYVRFSPLKTVPILVRISGKNFAATFAWSALPGSILSLPRGVESFQLQVVLADFVLGLPAKKTDIPPQHVLRWTVFEELVATENLCFKKCSVNPDCLTSFLGVRGCFYAFNNHSQQELSGTTNRSLMDPDQRSLSGKLSGCKTDGCGAAQVQKDMMNFDLVEPDWQGAFARLSLALILEVGEQRFSSESGTIDVRLGLPVPRDAFAVLADAEDSQILQSSVNATDNGDLVIQVSEYDPLQMSSLRLLLLPMLPDKAFQVEWSPALPLANLSQFELQHFHAGTTSRCLQSGFVRHRYKLCDFGGAIPDVPVAVGYSPWTGQIQEITRFTVTPRPDSWAAQADWPQAATHTVKVTFDKVDSPAAWAVKKHGCSLLQKSNPAINESIVASADATCALLEECPENLCTLIDERGLGGESTWSLGRRVPWQPALPPVSVVKVMACLKKFEHFDSCKIPNRWQYQAGELQLLRHGVKLPVDQMLAKVVELGETGIRFLEGVQVEVNESETVSTLAAFHADLANAAWKLPTMPVSLLIHLAGLSDAMPEKLLQSMIKSPGKAHKELLKLSGPDLKSLREAFSEGPLMERLITTLEDASQLSQVATALHIAPNISRIFVSCAGCMPTAKVPLMADWQALLQYFPRLTNLRLEHMVQQQAIPGLNEALNNATKLKDLDLRYLALGKEPAHQFLESIAPLASLVWFHYVDAPDIARLVLQWMAANPPCNIETFAFYDNQLGPEMAKDLLALLQKLPLKELYIQRNQLGDEFGQKLVPIMRNLSSKLKRVKLSDNNFEEKTIEAIKNVCGKACENVTA